MRHIDAHIHIERGNYSLAWIDEFIAQAVNRGLDEIWLLEHCYRFREFVPMYDGVCSYSPYIDAWFHRKAGVLDVAEYQVLIEKVRSATYPIEIKFGIEVCYFKAFEEFIYAATKNLGLDFLVGSVHFIDDFAFDHKAEHWNGVDVDRAFTRYFETSADLAKSRLFIGIAHPDSVKLFGHNPSFPLLPYYDDLAAALAKNNMYAEMNTGCSRRCECTPGMDIELAKAMKKHGVNILTASDAHSPEDVGDGIALMEDILLRI